MINESEMLALLIEVKEFLERNTEFLNGEFCYGEHLQPLETLIKLGHIEGPYEEVLDAIVKLRASRDDLDPAHEHRINEAS